MKRTIFLSIILVSFMTALTQADTLNRAYVGVILLREGRVVDIFTLDKDDQTSIFYSGGLRPLNKIQVGLLVDKLYDSIRKDIPNGGTALNDAYMTALDIFIKESDSLPKDSELNIICFTDGLDTSSSPDNTLSKVQTRLSSGINGKNINIYTVSVVGDTKKKSSAVLEALAGGNKDNCWDIDDKRFVEDKLREIATPTPDKTPVLLLIIDQSQSLSTKQAIIMNAVESTVRTLFKKFDDLVKIPASGRTATGSPSTEIGRDEDEDLYYHAMQSFWIDPYEFTQELFEQLWGEADANHSAVKGAKLPVTNVSLYTACETCNKLSIQNGLKPAYAFTMENGVRKGIEWDKTADGYFLPTREMSEYANRAGTTTPYYTGTTIANTQANIKSSAPEPVGSYPANQYGLFDTTGNVKEWCFSRYARYPTDNGDVFEPAGSEYETYGASFANRNDSEARSAYRTWDDPNTESVVLGFRVARWTDEEEK
jgi:formylglycine-generating enzyme required for sulfatase activity